MGRTRKRVQTTEQAELRREFARLYELSGWNQVQCATQLNMTQGYVSKILNDEVAIEPATISHFKIRLADNQPHLLAATGPEWFREKEGALSAPAEKLSDKEKQAELMELKESFAALVKNEPEKALALTGVISYLRRGKKKKN